MVNISTIDSPFSSDVAFNAPNFDLTVQHGDVPAGVRRLVQRIEYESSDSMADLIRIHLRDPEVIPPKDSTSIGALGGLGGSGGGGGSSQTIRDTKLFQPGNEIGLSLGYGSQLRYIGSAIIRKIKMTFPREDSPSLEVVAYSKDAVMMDNAPEASKKKKGKGGRIFRNTTFADAVRERASDYDFRLEIDDTPDSPHNFIQKVGLSDYDFIAGIANITGYYFWVDRPSSGKWTLWFKNPDTLQRDLIQEKVYTFRYAQGNRSSLLEFEPELAIQGATTKLQAKVKDPISGKTLEAEFEEENDSAPDPLAEGFPDLRVSGNELEGSQSTASDIKLFLNDFSFQVHADRRFKTEAELIAWAKQWFRRHRENFVLSSGTIIGVENVMARQIHKLEGLGSGLDGDYFFSNVTHVLDTETGYFLECSMRKVVPGLA